MPKFEIQRRTAAPSRVFVDGVFLDCGGSEVARRYCLTHLCEFHPEEIVYS